MNSLKEQAESAHQAFLDHLVEKAEQARLKYGLYIDAETIMRMLGDRDVVRYPVDIEFDSGPLQPHEFAYAQRLGFHSSDGFVLFLHPAFRNQPENLPLLIAYHLPSINYGAIVDAEASEHFGAALLGIDHNTYYRALCELADSLGGGSGGSGGCGGSCSCG